MNLPHQRTTSLLITYTHLCVLPHHILLVPPKDNCYPKFKVHHSLPLKKVHFDTHINAWLYWWFVFARFPSSCKLVQLWGNTSNLLIFSKLNIHTPYKSKILYLVIRPRKTLAHVSQKHEWSEQHSAIFFNAKNKNKKIKKASGRRARKYLYRHIMYES